MKIIYNSIIPFQGYICMNIFGVLFVRKEHKHRMNKTTINHESIHSEQYKDLLYILFLPLYILEWIIKIPISLFYKNNINNFAYRSISFEQEAYYNEKDYKYLTNRKRYNWIKYIFKMYSKK